jgi:protein-L-isoaspartate O-methyltransferase
MDDKAENGAIAFTDKIDEYRFGYTHEEMERLEYQHHVWAEENQRFISRAGFSTGSTLVDLGCGPGYTTLDLARIVGSEGKVIAVDRDGERSLPLLKAKAEAAGLSNIETRAAFSQSGRHVQKNPIQFFRFADDGGCRETSIIQRRRKLIV